MVTLGVALVSLDAPDGLASALTPSVGSTNSGSPSMMEEIIMSTCRTRARFDVEVILDLVAVIMIDAPHDRRGCLHKLDKSVRLFVTIPSRELEFESIHVGHGIELVVSFAAAPAGYHY